MPDARAAPLLVGQSLELWRPPLADALRARDPAPLRVRAARQVYAGADALDVNLGAGVESPPAALADDLVWAAATIREAAPGVALWLDCLSLEALALALAAVPPPVVANAVPAGGSPGARALLDAAAASGAGVVLSPATLDAPTGGAAPASLDALLAAAEETRALLAAAGLAEAWFDCLAYPAATDAPRARRSLALVRALAAAADRADGADRASAPAPRLRPLLAVGNVSHGTPPQRRPEVRRVYAVAAVAAGAEALLLPVEQPGLLDAIRSAAHSRRPASTGPDGAA